MALFINSITRVGNTVTVNWTKTDSTLRASGIMWGKTSTTTSNYSCAANRNAGTWDCAFTSTCSGNTYAKAIAIGEADSGIVSIAMGSCLPTVTTNNITAITYSGATCGGNVTTDGPAITARGVCWNTLINPTIVNPHSHDGSGTGSFTSSITGLSENKLYHVRAYATNSAGTSYGTDKTFTSLIKIPSLTGGTDVHTFPNIGWSGKTSSPTWTGATHIRWYHKISTDPAYTLIATIAKATLTKTYLILLPNLNYSFYCTYYSATAESQPSNVITINNNVSPPTATYSSILII